MLCAAAAPPQSWDSLGLLPAPWCPETLLSPCTAPRKHTYHPPAPMSHRTATMLPGLPALHFPPIATKPRENLVVCGRGTRQRSSAACLPLRLCHWTTSWVEAQGPGGFLWFSLGGREKREWGEPRIQGLWSLRGESAHECVVGTGLASVLAARWRPGRPKEGMVKFH